MIFLSIITESIWIFTRSPLNVVHAGIELLRETLLARFEDKTVLDLIADVYDSSVMAINILADLLSFENLDAGGALTQSAMFSPVILDNG